MTTSDRQLTPLRAPQVEVGRTEQLVVMHIESPASWFGQLAKLDADALAAMEEAMQSQYAPGRSQPLSSAPIGTFCAAFSSVHQAVFRAKVRRRRGQRAGRGGGERSRTGADRSTADRVIVLLSFCVCCGML